MRLLAHLAAVFALMLAMVGAIPATAGNGQERAGAAPFLVIVHPSSPVTRLDRRFVREAFLKKVMRWPDGRTIRPVDLDERAAARRRFSDQVLNRSVAAVKSYWQQLIFSGRGVRHPRWRATPPWSISSCGTQMRLATLLRARTWEVQESFRSTERAVRVGRGEYSPDALNNGNGNHDVVTWGRQSPLQETTSCAPCSCSASQRFQRLTGRGPLMTQDPPPEEASRRQPWHHGPSPSRSPPRRRPIRRRRAGPPVQPGHGVAHPRHLAGGGALRLARRRRPGGAGRGRAGGPAEYVAVPRPRARSRTDWSGLPHHDADGRPIRYYVDAPGDDRPVGPPDGSALAPPLAGDRPAAGPGQRRRQQPYPPTQYAHVYWWNRAEGLLAIQYWFYYPFNEWVNHHEGDWEHIQVVLRGASPRWTTRAAFAPVGHQYLLPRLLDASRRSWCAWPGADPREDHPLVYVGGQGSFLAWSGMLQRRQLPAARSLHRAPVSGRGLAHPDEDTSRPARFIAASDFQVILLPEPERLDAAPLTPSCPGCACRSTPASAR